MDVGGGFDFTSVAPSTMLIVDIELSIHTKYMFFNGFLIVMANTI